MFTELDHPNFLAVSDHPPRRTVGHQNGGIVCFVSDRIRPFVHSVVTTMYTIRFNVLAHTVMVVYFPPSLSHLAMIRELCPPAVPISLVIGDVNARFGATTGNRTSGPVDRQEAILLSCQHHGLSLLRPSPLVDPGPDCVAATPALRATLQVVPPPVRSDHHLLLQCSWSLSAGTRALSDTFRYNVHRLCNPLVAANFVTFASSSLGDLSHHLFALHRSWPSLPTEALMVLLDDFNSILLSTIQWAAHHVLGSHGVSTSQASTLR